MVAYVVDALREHIEPVASNMRLADVQEIWAAGKIRPNMALRNSFALSRYMKTIMVDDVPVGMFGVTPMPAMSLKGAVWLLGTPALESVSMAFLRGCRRYVPEMLQGYSELYNYVDARNRVSIGWLKWLGFDILEAKPYGHLQMPFHKFVMENKNV